jgi:hypothetical protein
VIERQLELVLAEQPSLQLIESWDGIDTWAAEILHAQSTPGGPFACPLGTIAAELKNDEAFRPILDAAFRRWEARLATTVIAALQGGMLLARVRGDLGPLQDALELAVAELHRWEAKARSPRRARTAVDSHRAR